LVNIRLEYANRNPNLLLSGKFTGTPGNNINIQYEVIENSPYGRSERKFLTLGQQVTLREYIRNVIKNNNITDVTISSSDIDLKHFAISQMK